MIYFKIYHISSKMLMFSNNDIFSNNIIIHVNVFLYKDNEVVYHISSSVLRGRCSIENTFLPLKLRFFQLESKLH